MQAYKFVNVRELSREGGDPVGFSLVRSSLIGSLVSRWYCSQDPPLHYNLGVPQSQRKYCASPSLLFSVVIGRDQAVGEDASSEFAHGDHSLPCLTEAIPSKL